VAGLVILSLGMAPLFTLAADLAVSSAPPERAGAASGLSETSSELGGALGIALLGTIGTAIFRADATGHETLAEAVQAAERLPVALRADVLDPAREAFTHAFQVAATVSGAIVVAAAILVATVVRRQVAPPLTVAVEPCA
jgi:MFS transporter, DHA2 family, multidrug resistance protein